MYPYPSPTQQVLIVLATCTSHAMSACVLPWSRKRAPMGGILYKLANEGDRCSFNNNVQRSHQPWKLKSWWHAILRTATGHCKRGVPVATAFMLRPSAFGQVQHKVEAVLLKTPWVHFSSHAKLAQGWALFCKTTVLGICCILLVTGTTIVKQSVCLSIGVMVRSHFLIDSLRGLKQIHKAN